MLPENISTVTITGRYLAPNGRPLTGSVTFRAPAVLTFPDSDVILGGPVVATLNASGQLEVDGGPVVLPATDAPGMDPAGWSYIVTEQLAGVPSNRSYNILLPAEFPKVDLADIAPTDPSKPNYIPVEGPKGDTGATGAPGSRIYTGTDAPAAALGVDGDLYVRYETSAFLGVTSTTVSTWQKAAGAWTQLGTDVRGAAWYVNNTSTPSSTTKPGDLLLRTDTGDIWQRGATGWGSVVGNIKGPKGDQGVAGVKGDQGAPGTPGAPGVVQSVNGKSQAAVVLAAADVGAIPSTAAGAAGGVAQLDATGKVPAAQLPAMSGGGAVTSVNTKTGDVVLAAGDVGAATASHTHTAADVGAAPASHTHTAAEVGALATTARGAANGVASLDASSKIPIAQLPAAAGRNMWTPQALGFAAWSVDPAHVANPTGTPKAAVLQRLYLSGINITESTQVNRVVIFARGWAGSTAVPAARFYAGIYNEAGNRVATSGLVSSLPAAGQITGTAPGANDNHIGAVPITLTATATLAPGRYWAAFLMSAGAATDFYYMHVQNESPSAPANFFMGTAFQRAWCLASQTSLPATINQAAGEVGLDPAIMALAMV
ncbi:hypothetical protein GCM10018980_25350 [Streptomyces capoamus]|uniref:Uncharacterized protein n=1 Tax=Streptomyces capoamus TaxID=68183 RepID=A0A919C5L3_9ACTN|nr:collagen-like protein [Streptomyces capoamus]GGW19856.1 hypothetical protein GCM10010501_60120 [Streptomyces libani subsp. rufus]GHG46393.1 hypothetical protein GCM10018980_25350 [Streptomyces capoamus]